MTYAILPLTEDPWQVFTVDLMINGDPFHAQVEIRYLPAPDQWYLSIWDHASGEMLVNQIPLICSYGEVNDLFQHFRHLRDGRSMGSLIVLRAVDEPRTENPSAGNLAEFALICGDTYGT